jgi:hypothetical protein
MDSLVQHLHILDAGSGECEVDIACNPDVDTFQGFFHDDRKNPFYSSVHVRMLDE